MAVQPGEKGDLELALYRCYSPEPVTLTMVTPVVNRAIAPR
jgi:hypothetical protein